MSFRDTAVIMKNALGQLPVTSASVHAPFQPWFGADAAQRSDEELKHTAKVHVARLNELMHCIVCLYVYTEHVTEFSP